MTSNRRSLYINVVVFLAGFTTLAVELSAARLLGAYIGSDSLVWAIIVGLILLYLAVGFYVGGQWADQVPTLLMLYRIAAWGAVLSGVIPVLGGLWLPILMAQGKPIWETAIGSVLLFAFPVGLLGCILPFALRLNYLGRESVGRSAGVIYAFSTLGSMLGSLLSVLVLLPNLGTSVTYCVASVVLLVAVLVGIFVEDQRCFWRYVWMLLVPSVVFLVR